MLITSISGIRGTIGGAPGKNLTPPDVVNFASGYGMFLQNKYKDQSITIVIGRDARISGLSISCLFSETLRAMGINIIDLELASTPTVEMLVVKYEAQGGIIITASHNPKEYNGIKMLNSEGEFLSQQEGEKILEIVQKQEFTFAGVDNLGSYTKDELALEYHVNKILELENVNQEAISAKKFTVVVDGINSVGGIAIPRLLERLGVVYIPLYCEADGNFVHLPEPLEKNLEDLKQKVKETGADLGIAVDPDVDRLVLVSEDGTMFGEEYTLVACADYILSKKKGALVTNLSSTRALEDLARSYGQKCFKSPVGEKNVVEKMKEVHAVIGGEGSGGVIYPELHYGRDALIGVTLVLSLLVQQDINMTELRSRYSLYFMSKQKVELGNLEPEKILETLREHYHNEKIDTQDGLKIDFEDSWVHLRKSNTEAIVRIYSEASSQEEADNLAERFIDEIKSIA